MFVGEMEYANLDLRHWLGYAMFLMFLFLIVIVLLNILNGIAVSDIGKIQQEVATFYHMSIVDTISLSLKVKLLAEKVHIYPNQRPERARLCGLPLPGSKVSRFHYTVQTEIIQKF